MRGDPFRRPRVVADTAQTLVGVTIASMVLLAAVAAATAPAAAMWATVVVSGLVTALGMSLLAAVRDRDVADAQTAATRESATDLARHVGGVAVTMRAELEAIRAMTARISVLEEETAEMSWGVDRTENLLDDLEVAVCAVTGHPLSQEVVDVWRTVYRAMPPLDLIPTGEEHPFAHTSRRALETALRLVASTMPAASTAAVGVQTVDGVARVTLSSEDGGLEQAEVDQVFGPTPLAPLHVPEPLGRIALARCVMRHADGDIAYIRALGRSNYVFMMSAVETPVADETPPILTLTLPLEVTDDSEVSGSGAGPRLND